MFIVDLNYVVPLEKLDEHMKDHVIFLKKYYKQNVFVVSGRKVPRTGGIIVAQAPSREALSAIMQEDPFVVNGLAEITITEFLASQHHPAFGEMLSFGKS